jgi:hypothetical protein
MAASLARHLALVTCKEPLKGNLATHIRTALVEQGFGEVARDDVILLLAGENWDVACTAIERAAMERAVSDVDSSFEASFDARRGWAQLQVRVYLPSFGVVAHAVSFGFCRQEAFHAAIFGTLLLPDQLSPFHSPIHCVWARME